MHTFSAYAYTIFALVYFSSKTFLSALYQQIQRVFHLHQKNRGGLFILLRESISGNYPGYFLCLFCKQFSKNGNCFFYFKGCQMSNTNHQSITERDGKELISAQEMYH